VDVMHGKPYRWVQARNLKDTAVKIAHTN